MEIEVVPSAQVVGNPTLQIAAVLFMLVNLAALVVLFLRPGSNGGSLRQIRFFRLQNFARNLLVYQALIYGSAIMLLPFYWMIVTSFKDAQTASASPPVWTPSRIRTFVDNPEGVRTAIVPLEPQKRQGQPIRVVPEDQYTFQPVSDGLFTTTKEVANPEAIFLADPKLFERTSIIDTDLRNFRRAWYRPEETSRGEVNFWIYFKISIISSALATFGTLITSALAAFAFARLEFFGKTALFYIILATMMVPGQVLLIPNFLLLSAIGWLDTMAALVVPWLASVFTIFLMRQFFMGIPDDLWDAARIDGASRMRFLVQIVIPLSKPVFITAGLFDFLANWNSLLWPLIVTSSARMRTLMVGLQTLNDEAGAEYHILMAASCLAILPVVILFFFVQRFFIEGIARTGLK